MLPHAWHTWLTRLGNLIHGTHRRRPRGRPLARSTRPMLLEQLETRLAPAANITIIAGASGTGDQDAAFLANGGQLLFAAPDTTNNTLSTGALTSIGATTNIIVQATNTITFNDLGGTVTLQTGAGNSANFSTDTMGGGAISFNTTTNTLATSGGDLVFIAGTNLTLANLATSGGNASLTAGTQGAGNLSAQGATAGAGNVTLQATNAAGGTITQVGTVSGALLTATATGNVSVDALSGTTVSLTSNTGSVSVSGTNQVQASTQLTLAAATGITVSMLTPSVTATNATSGNIALTQAASPATALTVAGTGVVNSASGGTVNVSNLGSSISIATGATVTATNGDVTLAVSGNATAAITGPGTADNVADVVGNHLSLTTAGGAIGTSAAVPLEINATTLSASSAGGNIFLSDTTGGVAVNQVSAGAGNVNLKALAGNLTATTPNDLTPEVVGNTVTLTTTGTGQIGAPGTTPNPDQFFEVDSSVLNATTTNSDVWIAEVGSGASAGTAIGSINVGAGTAHLRADNGGNLTSNNVDGTADVVAASLVLRTSSGGSVGTGPTAPLEIDATTLDASLTGTGGIFILDTSGGLAVTQAVAPSGAINLQSVGTGANLALTSVNAAGNTVTLGTTGAITGVGTGANVTAQSLGITGAASVGTVATPLATAVSTFAASVGSTGFVMANTGALSVGSVGTTTGITATGGVVFLSAASALTVTQNITTPFDICLVALESTPAAAGDVLTVNAGVTINSTAGRVRLLGGDGVVVRAGATVQASSVLDLSGNFRDDGNNGGVVIQGTMTSSSNPVTVVSDVNQLTVNLDFTGGASLSSGLFFDGRRGTNNTLIVSDQGGNGARNYTLTSTSVNRSGSGLITYAGLGVLALDGGNGGNNVIVQSATPTTSTTVQGGTGSDTFSVLVAPDSGYSNIQFQGGPGSTLLSVTAAGNATIHNQPSGPSSGTIVVNYTSGLTSTLLYQTIGQIQTNPPAS
jgi:hypothetical protein